MTDWYIAYTSSSGERLACEDLLSYGFEVFLPLETVRLRPARHRKDRTVRIVERPLFPRYLFVGFKPGWHDFAGARRSKRVLDFLRDAYGCPVRIDAGLVEAMRADMAAGKFDEAATKAKKLAEKAAIEAERRKALAETTGQIKVGHTFTMQNGLWKGFLATVTAVRKKDVRVEVKGEEGATLSLDVPALFYEEIGLLSKST